MLVSLTLLVALSVGAGAALAASDGPGWSLDAISQPTNFNRADTVVGEEELTVTATSGTYGSRPIS